MRQPAKHTKFSDILSVMLAVTMAGLTVSVCIGAPVQRTDQKTRRETKEAILQQIEVKDGDTLWGVANYYLKDPRAWPEILKHNKLPSSDPGVILPGMKLNVPVLLVKEHLRPAHLVYLLNDVRFRKRDTSDWKKASEGIELFNEDGLRTMAQSKASVRFLTGETVLLDEHSLVILRPEKKREEVELFAGSIRASKTKVITDSAHIDPKIDPKTKQADFKTRIKPDKTTLVEVYEGIVDVTAQGKTVTLQKGFGTEVKHLQPPSLPRALPPLPEFEPDVDAKKTDVPGSGQDKLNLNLAAPAISAKTEGTQAEVIRARIEKYRMEISGDPGFKNVLVDWTDTVRQNLSLDLKNFNLPDGKYFYRLAYIDELGFESSFSPVRSFVIDTAPPMVEIFTPKENEETTSDFIHIDGKTEPGTQVSVQEKNVVPDDTGRFTTALISKMGRNTIVITARDNAGNVSQIERNVYRVKKITSRQKSGAGQDKDTEVPGWLSKPGKIVMTSITFLVIAGVLVLIFRK